MLYEEFRVRTGYVCGQKEFWGIVSEYNHGPLCKDEFCRRWKVMNRERIAANKCAQNRLKDVQRMAMEAYSEYLAAEEAYRVTHNRQQYYKSVDWYESWEKYRDLAKELEDRLYNE